MCFIKTKESKLLIAKRDIIVYKVGIYADVQMFTPYFMTVIEEKHLLIKL